MTIEMWLWTFDHDGLRRGRFANVEAFPNVSEVRLKPYYDSSVKTVLIHLVAEGDRATRVDILEWADSVGLHVSDVSLWSEDQRATLVAKLGAFRSRPDYQAMALEVHCAQLVGASLGRPRARMASGTGDYSSSRTITSESLASGTIVSGTIVLGA